MRFKLNDKGFGIPEILFITVAVAVMSGIVSTMTSSIQAAQSGTKYANETSNFNDELWQQLSSGASCLNTLSGVTVNSNGSTNLTSLRDDRNTEVFTVGGQYVYGDSTISIQSMKFVVPVLAPNQVEADGTLSINYRSNLSTLARRRDIPVAFAQDPVRRKILNCLAKSKHVAGGPWGLGNTDQVYFAKGNVGVGTDKPRALFDVNGTLINAPGVANSGNKIDFSLGNYQFTTASCGAMTLNNVKEGGEYSLVVRGAAAGLCRFTAYSDTGTTKVAHVRYGGGYGVTTSNTYTEFHIQAIGPQDVYVSATTGYADNCVDPITGNRTVSENSSPSYYRDCTSGAQPRTCSGGFLSGDPSFKYRSCILRRGRAGTCACS